MRTLLLTILAFTALQPAHAEIWRCGDGLFIEREKGQAPPSKECSPINASRRCGSSGLKYFYKGAESESSEQDSLAPCRAQDEFQNPNLASHQSNAPQKQRAFIGKALSKAKEERGKKAGTTGPGQTSQQGSGSAAAELVKQVEAGQSDPKILGELVGGTFKEVAEVLDSNNK